MSSENISIELIESKERKVSKQGAIKGNNKKISQSDDNFINETDCGFNIDVFVAKQLDYSENYIMSGLKKIADYYDINYRKLKKDDLIQEIVIYECDPSNEILYMRRKRSWQLLMELKEDPKLKHYIIF